MIAYDKFEALNILEQNTNNQLNESPKNGKVRLLEFGKNNKALLSLAFLTLSVLFVFILISLNSSPDPKNTQAQAENPLLDKDDVDIESNEEYLNLNSLVNTEAQVTNPSNPIQVENQKPGTDAWYILNNKSNKITDDQKGQIKGYANKVSLSPSESINFKVSVNPSQKYNIDVYRVGYYQGLGGRLMKHIGPLSGTKQPDCPTNATNGMIKCNWQTAYTLTVPANWTSGVYVAMLTNSNNYKNLINFVVKDARKADILYQQPVFTWQAYNRYPLPIGKSFYPSDTSPAKVSTGGTQAFKLSFERPYAKTGTELLKWEIYLIRWLEKKGYDVSYSTDLDVHLNGANLLNYKTIISAGHGEYWTKSMRDSFEKARDTGVNLAFLGANDAYWQIRLQDNNRTIIGYKQYASQDPVQGPTTTTRFRTLGRPEQTLMGIQYGRNLATYALDYTAINTSSWVYANTGFADGDKALTMVGHEYDNLYDEYDKPVTKPGTAQTLLSNSFDKVGNKYANSSIYQAPSGAWVFAAGSLDWGKAIDQFDSNSVVDPRIAQMTKNIMDAFVGKFVVPSPTPSPTLTPSPTPTPTP